MLSGISALAQPYALLGLLCAELVQDELGKVLRECLSIQVRSPQDSHDCASLVAHPTVAIQELARFDKLREAVLKTSQDYLLERGPEALLFIRNLIKIEVLPAVLCLLLACLSI